MAVCPTWFAARRRPRAAWRAAIVSAVLAASVSLGTGCITPTQSRHDALLRSVYEYNDGVRWKKYERVVAHLDTDEAQRFATRAAGFGDDYEMADEEVLSIVAKAEDETRAEVTVAFSWYDRRRALLRKATVVEAWAFKDGRWLCESQKRVQGDGFPLVPEKAPDPNSPPASAPPPGAAPPKETAPPGGSR